MPMRLSGLASGMDTESIVTELMKVQRLKSTKIENKITMLEWKQEKWKALNTKIYSFYTGSLSKMRMQGSFLAKKATSSNEAKATITAATNAPEGTHSLQVKQLASAQIMTSGQMGTDINGKQITSATLLKDLGFDANEGSTITINAGQKTVTLDVGKSTTVNDFLTACKNAGLNANYDTSQKRFFISSKESGVNNSFSITMNSSEEAQDRNAIRDFLNYGSLGSTQKSTVDKLLQSYIDPTLVEADRTAIKDSLLKIKHDSVRQSYINSYINNQDNIDAVTAEERERLEAELPEGETLDQKVLDAAVKKKLQEKATAAANAEFEAWKAGSADTSNVFEAAETDLENLLTSYSTDDFDDSTIVKTNSLGLLKLDEVIKNADGSVTRSTSNSTLVEARDAVIILDGVEMNGSSNDFTVNGLTITLKGVTAGANTADPSDDEIITVGVTGNSQAIYDSIKDFIKTYNELLKEMNEAYNAVSARGYDPLTDEQKEAMTDSQIEKWEAKIKDSLLRRDDTLNSILSSMRTILSGSVDYNGKKYSLSSFGIRSMNYTEKGQLHIYGDQEDPLSSAFEDKLMKAITEDPDQVMTVFNKLAGDLYNDMTERMSSTKLSSALTFYNDKEMTNTVRDYKSDLKRLEAKLNTMENKYYKQFSAMETAMAKLNSQSSSMLSMLGYGMQY